MSVIAWDGKIIAADRRGSRSGFKFSSTKIWTVEKHFFHPELAARYINRTAVLAVTGFLGAGKIMVEWWKAGADLSRYPVTQSDKEDFGRLIVATPGGVIVYERFAAELPVEDRFFAWGTGRDYALGAMAAGKDAIDAITIASRFDLDCGGGVDAFDVMTGERIETNG